MVVVASILLAAAVVAAEAVEDVAAKVETGMFGVARTSAVGEGSGGIAQAMAAMEHM